jgi:hypothetical protein
MAYPQKLSAPAPAKEILPEVHACLREDLDEIDIPGRTDIASLHQTSVISSVSSSQREGGGLHADSSTASGTIRSSSGSEDDDSDDKDDSDGDSGEGSHGPSPWLTARGRLAPSPPPGGGTGPCDRRQDSEGPKSRPGRLAAEAWSRWRGRDADHEAAGGAGGAGGRAQGHGGAVTPRPGPRGGERPSGPGLGSGAEPPRLPPAAGRVARRVLGPLPIPPS